MRFDRMTIKLQEAFSEAQSLCEKEKQQALECEHLLLALFEEPEGLATALVRKVGVDSSRLQADLRAQQNKFPRVDSSSFQVYLSDNLKKTVDFGFKEAEEIKDEFLNSEHILLAVAQNAKTSAGKIFRSHGLKREALLNALMTLRGSQRITDQNPEAKYQVLQKYCIDLTEKARSGKLDPVIGRDVEIRRVIQVLSRRTKNNPVLIGEPGVGKTAIV